MNIKKTSKFFAATLILFTIVSAKAYAISPFSMFYMHEKSDMSGASTTFSDIPTGAADGIAGLDGTTSLLQWLTFGSRLSMNHSTNQLQIDLTAQPESNVTSLISDLSARLVASNNLSDLTSTSTARTNLGLGTAATQASSAFATSAQGALASSATQPGANISTFTNDSAYVTATSSPVTSVNGHTGAVTLTIPSPTSTTYQAFVTQTGTATPTAVQFVNDFGGVTFAWGRTGTGTYTLTASSPVFTSNKTAVLMSTPSNPLAAFKYTVTSSTVITFGTSLQSLASLLTLNLATTPTDALFANTMIYVLVYP